MAHDHPGSVTNFWLGVKGMMNPNGFNAVEKLAWMQEQAAQFPELATMAVNKSIPAEIWQQVAYHDLGLYEVIWSLCMFAVFLVLDRKPRPPGFFVGMTFLSYGPIRLMMDVFRHPTTDTRYLGFTPAQYLSVGMALVGVWILWANRNKPAIRTLRAAAAAAAEAAAVAAAPASPPPAPKLPDT